MEARGERNVGRQRWRRQRARRTTQACRELTNSMVNGSTSDSPVETHNAGLACRGYPGKRGVSRRHGQKDLHCTSVGDKCNFTKEEEIEKKIQTDSNVSVLLGLHLHWKKEATM
ncbi:hypothetical protein EYF80_001702 [Liparis tanakae]|uniref:Uncharacterized protein n=1 Tax=Liparis tanakae TaxID=230148 RepID=A0A4Z2JDN0_9TELE|nr:hypothetical protein EYF80_001702 [Liparis tanakae]